MTRFNIFAAATTGLAAVLISTPALAGDPSMDAAPTMADYFNAADSSGDAALDSGEFRIFVDTLADGGKAKAIAVRESSEYDAAFIKADTDADGMVTYFEVNSHNKSVEQDVKVMSEDPAPEWVPPVADEAVPDWEDTSDALDDVDEMSPDE